jgi:hypothetical protein
VCVCVCVLSHEMIQSPWVIDQIKDKMHVKRESSYKSKSNGFCEFHDTSLHIMKDMKIIKGV